MYRFTLLTASKLKRGPHKELADEYLKWMAPYAKWTVRETDALETLPDDGSLLILLDEAGKTFDSSAFAKQLDRWAEGGARPLTFIIGAAFGFDETFKKGADVRLALSPMTMPHDLARVVLLEQLYRAMTIQSGKTYHY